MPKKGEKKVKKENMDKIEVNNNDALLDIIKNQKEVISNLENKNITNENTMDLLQKQLTELQMAMIKIQSNNTIQTLNKDKLLSLRCRFLNGITLYSPKREVEIRVPYNQDIEISEDEMQMLMKTSFVRDFLKKDVIYFRDEENYKKFKVFDRFDLSDEKIINVVTQSSQNKLVEELNKYTNSKKDDPVFHSLFYRIVDLYNNGKLIKMTYENRKTIEEYFRFEISNAQFLLHRFKEIETK